MATLKLSSRASVSASRVAAVKLSCSSAAGASCAGTLTLTTKVTRKIVRKGKTVTKTTTVTIGTARYGVAQGTAATIKVTLSASGKRLLAAARHHQLKVTASTQATAGSAPTVTLTLTAAMKKTTKKKR